MTIRFKNFGVKKIRFGVTIDFFGGTNNFNWGMKEFILANNLLIFGHFFPRVAYPE